MYNRGPKHGLAIHSSTHHSVCLSICLVIYATICLLRWVSYLIRCLPLEVFHSPLGGDPGADTELPSESIHQESVWDEVCLDFSTRPVAPATQPWLSSSGWMNRVQMMFCKMSLDSAEQICIKQQQISYLLIFLLCSFWQEWCSSTSRWA